jgi:hypothetical protein
MDKLEKIYIEPRDRLVQQIALIVTFIPGSLIILYITLRGACLNYYKGDMEQAVAALIGTISAIIAEYASIIALVELWKRCVKVELHTDRIIGYPRLGKKVFEMNYADIASIGSKRWGGWIIKLVDNKNNELQISQHINSLGECMNMIRERAVNATKIDLRKWENDKRLWGE